ncbi:MAG TPA: rhomboid family intramembrane serine protease [Bacteroidia bacterium]|jgi:membrane associated rhomboid family serine protease|nr:rhomboid family intramembrane serine protease [Bacteroidia bacterium]
MANTNWATGIQKVKGFSAVTQLLLLNGLVFLAANVIANLFKFNLLSYLALPASVSELGSRFYTPVSYMFSHADLGHAFFNMLYLYFMGQIFASIVGQKRLWFVYLGGGLAGAIFFMILFNIFFTGEPAYLLGASASVTAVAIACAVYAPNMPVNLFFFGSFALKWVVLVWFLISTVIDFSINTGGKVAHLGGAFFGLAYAWQLRKGNDWMNIFSFKRKAPARVIKMQAAQKKIENEEKTLNEILDKINRSGYESLSKQEKETLQKIAAKK